MRRFLLAVALASLPLLAAAPAVRGDTGVDEARLANFGSSGLLRWENIEGPPYWIAGMPLRYEGAKQLHFARISPGQEVVVHVPAGCLLRVAPVRTPLQPDDLQLWVSNGSGLDRVALSGIVRSDGSLLFTPTDWESTLVRVTRTAQRSGCIDVALFLSRRIVPDEAFSYPCQWIGCESPVTVSQDELAVGAFQYVKAGQPARIRVAAPARLRIESRLEYASLEAESHQTYQLRIRGHGLPERVQPIHTRFDRRHVNQVDGTVRLLGEQEVDYLDVPVEAEQLVITSTANTLLRISAAPCRTAYPVGWEGTIDASLVGSIWDLDAQQVSSQLAASDYPASRRWRIAQRLGRDNRYRDGGLQAWNLLRQLAAEYPAHRDLERWASKAKQTYTTYVTMLPAAASGKISLEDAWFVSGRLSSPEAGAYSPVLPTSLVDDALASLAGGTFIEVPAAGSIACPLPPDLLDTQIRVAVARLHVPAASELRVQCDAAAAIRLRLNDDPRVRRLPRQATMAESALAALERQFGPFAAGTLGAPFASRRHAAPWIEAATAELNVARGTRWIRLVNDSPHSLRVALAYRTSREVALSESEFLACLTRQPDFGATFLAIVQGTTPPTLADSDAFAELRNHCEPLLRQLQRHQRTFTAAVSPSAPSAPIRTVAAVDVASATLLCRQARERAEQQQWLEALELWSTVIETADGPLRREAISQRVQALAALGENVLAETELRGRVLYDTDPDVRHAAAQQLAEIYRSNDDSDGLLRLAAAALLADPNLDSLVSLAAAASENDDWQTALIALLAMPPERRSAELLLEAAYHEGWWQVFHLTLDQLTDTSARNYWAALWAIRQGDYAAGVPLLQSAGARGQAFHAHIVRGQQIVSRLQHPDFAQRLQAVREWELWTATHPGPHAWRRDESLVSACQRVDRLASDPADDGYPVYRATLEQPVELCVNGPIELQIDARPLHPASASPAAESSLNDWLVVRGLGRQLVWPITANRPAENMVLRTDPDHVPGRLVTTQLRLGPGRHRLHVWGEARQLLVRASVRRPRISLQTLPPITPATVAAVLDGRWGMITDTQASGMPEEAPRRIRTIAAGVMPAQVVELPLVRPASVAESPGVSPVVTAWQRATWGLRDGTLSAEEANHILAASQSTASTALTADEMMELAARAGVPPAQLTSLTDPQAVIDWQWMCVHHGHLVEALRVDPGSDRRARQVHVALLLRLVQQQPSLRAPCAVQLAELAKRHFEDRFVAAQFDRLKEPGEWVLFGEVESSGGLYFLPDNGPRHSAQASRVRRALAGPADPQHSAPDYFITGYRKLSVELTEPRAVVLELALRQPQISYLPAPRLQVEIKVDDGPPQTFAMPAAAKTLRVPLSLAAGRHRVELRVVNPYSGHYVFLDIHEIGSQGERLDWQTDDEDLSNERLYHVATPSTPVQLRLRGPAWIRVERVIQGRREIGETTVAQGDREMTLSAPDGVKYALYRIWEYRFDNAPAAPPVFTVTAEPMPAPTRWLDPSILTMPAAAGGPWALPAHYVQPLMPPELTGLAPADAPAGNVEVADAFPLGGYEDGTWGWGAGVVHRRALEEGRQLTGEDRFAQLALSYEHFRPQSDSYAKTIGLFRLREASGPTFGLTHETWQPLEPLIGKLISDELFGRSEAAWLRSLQLNNLWTAYFQHPSDAIAPYDSQTETALGARTRLYWRQNITDRCYHIPSLTLFSRWLSLDGSFYEPDRVDQDVFTPFKDEQRVGLYLTDSWIHEPVESARVWIRPAVFTNEDFNFFRPDHISLQTGVSSLWGQTDWQLAYRVARFLEDNDRARDTTQHLLYFDAAVDRWQHAGSRYELAVSVRHDLADGDTSAFLTLTHFVSRGRGYRDQHPSEVGFRAMRERVAYPTWQFFEPFGL